MKCVHVGPSRKQDLGRLTGSIGVADQQGVCFFGQKETALVCRLNFPELGKVSAMVVLSVKRRDRLPVTHEHQD